METAKQFQRIGHTLRSTMNNITSHFSGTNRAKETEVDLNHRDKSAGKRWMGRIQRVLQEKQIIVDVSWMKSYAPMSRVEGWGEKKSRRDTEFSFFLSVQCSCNNNPLYQNCGVHYFEQDEHDRPNHLLLESATGWGLEGVQATATRDTISWMYH